jgi:hypothetical protein
MQISRSPEKSVTWETTGTGGTALVCKSERFSSSRLPMAVSCDDNSYGVNQLDVRQRRRSLQHTLRSVLHYIPNVVGSQHRSRVWRRNGSAEAFSVEVVSIVPPLDEWRPATSLSAQCPAQSDAPLGWLADLIRR